MQSDHSASAAAEILNAGYLFRQYRRPFQARQRAQAMQMMGLAARDGLVAAGDNPAALAAVLWALAEALLPFDPNTYDRRR